MQVIDESIAEAVILARRAFVGHAEFSHDPAGGGIAGVVGGGDAMEIQAGEEVIELSWAELQPMLQDFWVQVVEQLTPRQAPGRLKQWLAMLTRNYPEAVELFTALRRETDLDAVGHLLGVQRTEAA